MTTIQERLYDQNMAKRNNICHSGGCPGSDMEWENQSSKYDIKTIAYSFQGHVQEGKYPKILSLEVF